MCSRILVALLLTLIISVRTSCCGHYSKRLILQFASPQPAICERRTLHFWTSAGAVSRRRASRYAAHQPDLCGLPSCLRLRCVTLSQARDCRFSPSRPTPRGKARFALDARLLPDSEAAARFG
jgi:hypothetical protein